MPQWRIERFDGATDARALESCFHIVQESIKADQPDQAPWSAGAFGAKWVEGFSGYPQETWFAADASGEIVGCYLLMLPDRENLSMARVVPRVSPGRRRAGVGTALLRHCEDRARLAARTRLVAEAWDGTSGAEFAKALGASPGIPDVHRTLYLTEEVRSRLPGLRAEASAHASGYSLVSWVGPTPEDRLDQVAAVHAAMTDAPRDAGVEPSVWDPTRIRRLELLAAEHGITHYTVVARHDASGELAALTQTLTDPGAPAFAFQQVTAVRPAHRGHRLGLLVKVAMLDLLAEAVPEVDRIPTDNAGSNEHMIAINARLGYEVTGVTRNWELDLSR
ncbi:MAG: GNAT family N-acetyltransferase [Actinobacteria bacterium]|nr:GNAT family N-acetyltransferase [Actinomycetota bacterium]